MQVKKLCELVKTGLRDFIYASKCSMYCDVWRDKNLCGINLCDRHLTRILHINKTLTEKCTFTVFRWPAL